MFKPFTVLILLLALLASPATSVADGLGGLLVLANDGTFLGAITCGDIGNPYSRHGSRFSSVSIWNKYSRYGSEFSSLSPYNRFTSTPPVLVDANGNAVGHLSTNQFVANAISPVALEAYLIEACGQSGYRE